MQALRKGSILTVLYLCSMATTAALESDTPTVLITGANRGIGLEFVRQFSERGWNVVVEQLDVTDHTRIDWLADIYKDQPIDILLSNAGITPKYASAFKRLKGVDFDMALQSLEVNAIGPLKLAQAFMDHVAASEQKKIIIISSTAGSFAHGPQMPMMYSYRASKAALNMYMYALSFETPKRDIILTVLSPGSVRTFDLPGMKPPPDMIETDESVSKMLTVIDKLTPEHNGKFLDYDTGEGLDW